MWYLKKSDLSPRAIARFKRLAAFKNPEFYKYQAMRLPTYNKSRIITAFYEDEKYIGLPRGCEDDLFNLLNDLHIEYEIGYDTTDGVYTYVLLSEKDNQFYIGYTNNLERRLKEHQQGKNISTAKRLPVKLIYFEGHLSKEDAMRRESYFKTTKGKVALRQMIREYLAKL